VIVRKLRLIVHAKLIPIAFAKYTASEVLNAPIKDTENLAARTEPEELTGDKAICKNCGTLNQECKELEVKSILQLAVAENDLLHAKDELSEERMRSMEFKMDLIYARMDKKLLLAKLEAAMKGAADVSSRTYVVSKDCDANQQKNNDLRNQLKAANDDRMGMNQKILEISTSNIITNNRILNIIDQSEAALAAKDKEIDELKEEPQKQAETICLLQA
jgi:hypothetical protein